jgi:F-type H+-transporting ATPase subunit epsilon
MATFPLELVTPERLLFSEEVQAVRAPGIEGSFGVLAGHAPLLTQLTVGLIKITLAGGGEEYIATSGGFMQVSREKVIILADSAQLSSEINVERERAEAARMRQALEVPDSSIDAEKLRDDLQAALNRIQVAQMHGA